MAGPGRKLLWDDTHNTAGSSSAASWGFYPRPTGGVYYLTPSALLGLGATMYMFFIAFCGYCCLFALQTPDLFEGDQKKEMMPPRSCRNGTHKDVQRLPVKIVFL